MNLYLRIALVALATGGLLLVAGAVLLVVTGLSVASSVVLLAGGVLGILGGLGRLYAWPVRITAAEVAAHDAALSSSAMSQDIR